MQLITRVWLKMLKEWWQLTVPVRLRVHGVELGKGIHFFGMPIVGMAKGSRISIGDGVVLCSDSRFTALGVNHPVILRTLRSGATIIIGNNTGISGGSILAAIHTEIGMECLLGANVIIADTDFHPLNPVKRRFNNNPLEIDSRPIKIENNVFIGTSSIVLKGVRIGKNSVIGACSVVTKDVPQDSIVAGNPAKLVREL